MTMIAAQLNSNVAINMLWLVLAVLTWGGIHSLTASLGVKEWVRRRWGDSIFRYYRFVYNGFSVISFIPILWLMAVLPDQVLYQIPVPWIYLALVGQLVAVVILVAGLLQTDTLSFIGVRQLFEGRERSSQLVTHGLYRWIRHPLYTGGLLLIWITPVMTQNSLIVTIAATIYIMIGALFEERKLEREFGESYVEYKTATPMFIPGLKFRRNK